MFYFSRTLRKSASPEWICYSCQRRLSSTIQRKLPSSPARTRFAPSPTGYLHLGSLRTALFNYLLAKSTGGQFLLRIEDTDQKRTVPDAEERLFQDLEWAGLYWDEGPKIGGPYGPYKQSERTALYREHVEKLLQSGHAYRCFCSAERLHGLAKHQTDLGLPTGYDRMCTHLAIEESDDRAAKGEAHVIRFKSPNVLPPFTDLVYGKVQSRPDQSRKAQLHSSYGDLIIFKSDGFPTYHLANVVDDHHMKITHVVRGTEWMSSTPKHFAMYGAFGWKPPEFAHVGLLTDVNNQKLSKRKMDIDISALREKMGIFPETLTNFVALLGWSHNQRKDAMNLRQLIENFSLKFTRGNTIVKFDKLWYLQRTHAALYANSNTGSAGEKLVLMTEPITKVLKEKHMVNEGRLVLNEQGADAYISKLLHVDARNYINATAFIERNKYFFEAPDQAILIQSRLSLILNKDKAPEGITTIIPVESLHGYLSMIEDISSEDWTAETIRACVNNIIKTKTEQSLKEIEQESLDKDDLRKRISTCWTELVHRYIRWALVAGLRGPDGAETMEILGREETLNRFAEAVKAMAEKDGISSAVTNHLDEILVGVRAEANKHL